MLNVMLVDDNESVLEGMANIIDWEKYGYRIAFSAPNCDRALEALDKTDIDLIITDIRMPRMNGLEFISAVKEKNENLKFVLISGYSEFDYAKWAVDQQISGYLLKPVDEDELIEIIKRVKKEIEKEREDEARRMSCYVHNVLMGGHDYIKEQESLKTVRYCVIRPCCGEYLISNYEQYNTKETDRICGKVIEFIESSRMGYAVKNNMGEIELIADVGKFDISVNRYFADMYSVIKEENGLNAVILVGESVDSKSDIKRSKESIRLLENCMFYNEERNVFVYDECRNEKFFGFLKDNSLYDKLVYAIKNKSRKEVETAVSELCGEFKKQRIYAENVITYISNIIFDVSNYASENEGEALKYIYRCSLLKKNHVRFKQASDFLGENSLELWEFFQELKTKNTLGVIGSIIDYIDINYSDEHIRLQNFASKYYINASYLGTLFKEKIGMSFNAYLLNKRIEKAKGLLINTDYKIYEIAHKIGFTDANYFSAKFTELEKITPAKFREKNRR